MSLPAYPAEGQLVAVAGEEVICPECGQVQLRFEGDAYGSSPSTWPIHWVHPSFDGAAHCARCDTPLVLHPGSHCIECAAETGAEVRMHIRSGAWTGWRSIGAE